MPVTTTYLKVVRGQAIVKVVGDSATATIDIGSNIKLADETFAGYGSANVTINSVLWSSTDANAPILIKRPANGANVMILHGNDNWSLSQMMGFVDSSNSTANIAITMPAGGGTVYLGLSKVDGYTPPNQQVITKVTG